MRRRCRWLLALSILLSLPSATEASKFAILTVEQLAGDAELVVHGVIDAVETRRDAAGRIHTVAELRPKEVWKGHLSGPSCRVVAAGGRLGETVVTVSGQPEYRVGDEWVMFLVRNPNGEWVTLGLAHGHFRVRHEPGPTGETRWVHNLFWGSAGRPDAASAVAFPSRRPMSLEQLKARVREVSL